MNRRTALRNAGHTAGALILIPSLLTLLHSCKSASRVDWQPLFLSDEEARFISSMVDTLLPRTTTPGALDVKVDIFLDTLMAKTYNVEEQKNVRSEMAAFNEMCSKDHGGEFADLDQSGKAAALQVAETNSATFNGGVWGTAVGEQAPVAFYRRLKAMAVWAYCSSEEIGEHVLKYDPIPQEYLGCIPLKEGEHRWSL